MYDTEITVIRPLRTSDGQGGYIESIDAAISSRTAWAMVEVHKTQISLRLDAGEDIKPGDIVGINVEL
jgi:hypothetical protein